jgi:hypothetical protein
MSLSEPMSLVNSYSCTVGLRGFLLTHILIRLHPVRARTADTSIAMPFLLVRDA